MFCDLLPGTGRTKSNLNAKINIRVHFANTYYTRESNPLSDEDDDDISWQVIRSPVNGYVANEMGYYFLWDGA